MRYEVEARCTCSTREKRAYIREPQDSMRTVLEGAYIRIPQDSMRTVLEGREYSDLSATNSSPMRGYARGIYGTEDYSDVAPFIG